MTRATPDPRHEVGVRDRLLSAYHGLWLRVSEAVGRRGAPVHEHPAGELALPSLPPTTCERIQALVRDYDVRFESTLGAATALENYARLELIARAWRSFGRPLPQGGRIHDVGSASFWYAAALHAAFRPQELVGIEVEGYRRLKGGGNRRDHALGYVQGLGSTRYAVADYSGWTESADLVAAFYPFVTPAPVLAWRLPLSLLAPARLFERIALNLAPAGELLMVNQGTEEADVAARFAEGAGLQCCGSYVEQAPLTARTAPAVVSRWTPLPR